MGVFDSIFSGNDTLPRRKGFHISYDGTIRPGESPYLSALGNIEITNTTFVENEKAAREKAIEKARETIKKANDRIAEHEKWLAYEKAAKQTLRVNLHDKVAYSASGEPTPDRYRGIRGEVIGLRKLGEDHEYEAYVRWPTQPYRRDEWMKQSKLLVMEKSPIWRFAVGDRVRATQEAEKSLVGREGTVIFVDTEDADLPYKVQFAGTLGTDWMSADELEKVN